MRGYFNGTATYDEAMDNFYTLVLEKYPNQQIICSDTHKMLHGGTGIPFRRLVPERQ
jgi:hypothetical protein